MTDDEIREALMSAGGDHAFIDVADGGTFILDGAFTLDQIAGMGRVATRAMNETLLGVATDTEFGVSCPVLLVKVSSSPQVGDTIRATATSKPFYEVGDYARLLKDCEDFWEADFNDPRNAVVHGKGFWAIGSERFEVVR